MPLPSYTVDTLTFLREKYPGKTFALIMGGDNLESIEKWKNYQHILENYDIYLYQRPGYNPDKYSNMSRVKSIDAPLLNISSTFIRQAIQKENLSGILSLMQFLIISKVLSFTESNIKDYKMLQSKTQNTIIVLVLPLYYH